MEAPPEVQPGDWITVNKGTMHAWSAVVCSFSETHPGWVEVVYLDEAQRGKKVPRALQTYVYWKDARWQRAYSYPFEGYADTYSRLAPFVQILRRGRDLL